MANVERTVTVRTRKSATQRVPDSVREYVALAEWLQTTSVFDKADEVLPVARRGGVGTAGMMAFILAFFIAKSEGGLRGFWTSFRDFAIALGAVAGIRKLPSSSGLSRYLGSSIEMSQVDRFGEWLLENALDAQAVTHHFGASVIDGAGARWHMVDYDPSIKAFRQRALPEGKDLPNPKRLSEDYAAPGYPGRKRADVQYARGLLQHAGTGLWLHCTIGPGNGSPRQDFYSAVDAGQRWKTRMGVERCIIRFDGGIGGHLSNVEKCRSAGLNFITRLARYDLLNHDAVQAVIKQGVWRPVRDSGSGPQREAIDMGSLYPDLEETRVVLSRFVAEGERPSGAGCVRDGYQYEMFGTQLTTGWAAPEVVTAYYGRCGQENRFMQEDNELDLDRLFSESLAGQLFVVLIGLFLWNARTIRAALSLIDFNEVEPENFQEQDDVSAVVDEILADYLPTPDDFPQPSDQTSDEPRVGPTDLGEWERPVEKEVEVRESAPEADEPDVRLSSLLSLPTLALLALFNWSSLLKTYPGWTWSESSGLFCPRGLMIPPRGRPTLEGESIRIRFRAPKGPCHNCERRYECSSSTSTSFSKEVGWTLPLSSLNEAQLQNPRPCNPVPTSEHVWRPPPMSTSSQASKPVRGHRLIPSELRHAHRRAAEKLMISITVRLPSEQKNPSWLARNDGDRQHRRQTWTQRRRSHKLPASAVVHLRYELGSKDAKWVIALGKPET